MEKKKLIKIYIINIENKSIDDILIEYNDYIDKEDIEKSKEYKLEINQKQFLISTMLKKKYVGKNIYFNEYKKPLSDNIHFNISHSLNRVVIALSKDYNIGVDIECIKPNVNEKTINYIFNEEEKQYIDNENKKFYYLWTRKEAILKCNGTGLINDIKNINCINDDKYRLFSYYLDNYVMSIAIEKNQEDVEVMIEE